MLYICRIFGMCKRPDLYTILSTYEISRTTYTPTYQQHVDNFIPALFKTNIWNISDFILI